MSTLTTFKLQFEPHPDMPAFQRLAWEEVQVPLRDVLLYGIHPWSEWRVQPGLWEALLQRLNGPALKFPELEEHGYCTDLQQNLLPVYEPKPRPRRPLEEIQRQILFTEDLTYLNLLEVAKQQLRERWNHKLARSLAESLCPDFSGLRRFLKRKHPKLKLSGYADLANHDLSTLLSVEDFAGADRVLIHSTLPLLNFRSTRFLSRITDGQGRLRLTPRIDKVAFTRQPRQAQECALTWYVERTKDAWRFCPDLGQSAAKRRIARDFATQRAESEGRYCFTTSLDKMTRMLEEDHVQASFPALSYSGKIRGLDAAAKAEEREVPRYSIGGYPNRGWTGQALRELLRQHGVSMSGNKAALLAKAAKLAAQQYEAVLPELNAFFGQHRFVRCTAQAKHGETFPVLEEQRILRNLLLTLYCMKHLRGDAILDARHENNTFTEEQLALALMQRKVSLGGFFLPAA